jgi:hypothetical protein
LLRRARRRRGLWKKLLDPVTLASFTGCTIDFSCDSNSKVDRIGRERDELNGALLARVEGSSQVHCNLRTGVKSASCTLPAATFVAIRG